MTRHARHRSSKQEESSKLGMDNEMTGENKINKSEKGKTTTKEGGLRGSQSMKIKK